MGLGVIPSGGLGHVDLRSHYSEGIAEGARSILLKKIGLGRGNMPRMAWIGWRGIGGIMNLSLPAMAVAVAVLLAACTSGQPASTGAAQSECSSLMHCARR